MLSLFSWAIFFFFNDTATTEIYTLSLHDALPISRDATNKQILFTVLAVAASIGVAVASGSRQQSGDSIDRESTRLNSSHSQNSYAVFCLQKKTYSEVTTSPEALASI